MDNSMGLGMRPNRWMLPWPGWPFALKGPDTSVAKKNRKNRARELTRLRERELGKERK